MVIIMQDRRKIGSINKISENKYILRISSGYDDLGRRIQFSRTITAGNDTAAEKELHKFYNEKMKLMAEKKAPSSLNDLYNEFTKNHVCNLRTTTQGYYSDLWNNYIKKAGCLKLSKITPLTIKMIIDGISSRQNNYSCDRTKKGVYGMLFTMFKKAKMWGVIENNPCENVEPPKYKSKEAKIYNTEQLELIISYILKEDLRLQAIFFLSVLCGLRRSEIVGLKWDDIDKPANKIYVRRAAAKAKEIGTYTDKTKNTKSTRILPLPETVLSILDRLYNEQLIDSQNKGDIWEDENWLFTKWDGTIMNVDRPTELWGKFLKKYPDLPKTNLHALRHTCASLLINSGTDIVTVGDILGHAQTSTTLNIYAHTIERSKVKALTDLEANIIKISV